jgi:replicative DNA helicase
MIDRIPPHSIEVEQACLSCGLLSEKAVSRLREDVVVDDFYFDKHRIFCQCLFDLHDSKVIPDPVTVKEWHKKNNYEFEDQDFLNLYQSSASSAGIDNYIIQLVEYSKQREILKASLNAMEDVYSMNNSADIVNNLSSKLKEIDRSSGDNIIPLSTIMGKSLDQLQISEGSFLTTGIPQLDMKLIGMFEELIIIAARPSMGKTVLALNIAKHVAKTHDVFFFSLEQPAEDIAIRLLCSETNIEYKRLKIKGKLDLFELDQVRKAYERLYRLKLHIFDKPARSSKILNICRRGIKPALVVTDYLQLIIPEDKKLQRHLQVQDITRSFKNGTKELKVPHILLCQLNRASEIRKDKRPILSDLRESGDIEQDADKIIFIHRDFESDKAEFIIAKNRNGEVGIKDAIFDGKSMQFI